MKCVSVSLNFLDQRVPVSSSSSSSLDRTVKISLNSSKLNASFSSLNTLSVCLFYVGMLPYQWTYYHDSSN